MQKALNFSEVEPLIHKPNARLVIPYSLLKTISNGPQSYLRKVSILEPIHRIACTSPVQLLAETNLVLGLKHSGTTSYAILQAEAVCDKNSVTVRAFRVIPVHRLVDDNVG